MNSKVFIRSTLRLLLFLLCMELFLWAGGQIFILTQKYQNQINLLEGEAYRILCVGDSMTALGDNDSYPAQLEKILNERYKEKGVKFVVINKGVPGKTTKDVAQDLESYLNEYNPQMVVSMLGAQWY